MSSSAGRTVAGRCRMLGTRTGQGTRSHAPSYRGQRRAGLQRRARQRWQAPAHATSAACPGPPLEPLIDAEARQHQRRHRHPVPVEAPCPQRPHRPSSPHRERTQPVATHHPTAVTGDLDDHTFLPVGHDRVLAQPAVHRGITAVRRPPGHVGQDRSARPGQHPQPRSLLAPPALPDRSLSFRPAQPPMTPRRSVLRPALSAGSRWCCTSPTMGHPHIAHVWVRPAEPGRPHCASTGCRVATQPPRRQSRVACRCRQAHRPGGLGWLAKPSLDAARPRAVRVPNAMGHAEQLRSRRLGLRRGSRLSRAWRREPPRD